MSRIGKQPIQVPEKVQVTIEKDRVRVRGPLGEIERSVPPAVELEQKDNVLTVRPSAGREAGAGAVFGMMRARLAGMVEGVQTGFQKNLDVNGLGFKAVVEGDKLVLNIGFSHPIRFSIPAGIKIEVDKKMTKVAVRGIDKDLVGETAARLRSLKPPEPYKGTGIRYEGERVHRKAGKTAAGAGAGGGAGGKK